jgi:hypothetical protein
MLLAAASCTRVSAFHCYLDDDGTVYTTLLPFSCFPSTDRCGITICIVMPPDASLGSRVDIRRVSLAESEVALDRLPATIDVGYNTQPVPAGPVMHAAQAGNADKLIAALDAGGSLCEHDAVSQPRCFLTCP